MRYFEFGGGGGGGGKTSRLYNDLHYMEKNNLLKNYYVSKFLFDIINITQAQSEEEIQAILEKWGSATVIETELQNNIQVYINCFRSEIGKFLNTSIGQIFKIASFDSGVVVTIEQKPFVSNSDNFIGSVSSLKDALMLLNVDTKQYLKDQRFEGFEQKIRQGDNPFKDVEIFLANPLLIIKDTKKENWNDIEARKDVTLIIEHLTAISKNVVGKQKPSSPKI